MLYNFILNPITKKHVNIFSIEGQTIIQNYVTSNSNSKKRIPFSQKTNIKSLKKSLKKPLKKPLKKSLKNPKELTPIKTLDDMKKHLQKYGLFDKIKPVWNNVRKMSHENLQDSITDGLNVAIKYSPKIKTIIKKENKIIEQKFKQSSPFPIQKHKKIYIGKLINIPSPSPKKVAKSWYNKVKYYNNYFMKWSKKMIVKNSKFVITMVFASIFTLLTIMSDGLLEDFYKQMARNFIRAQSFRLISPITNSPISKSKSKSKSKSPKPS